MAAGVLARTGLVRALRVLQRLSRLLAPRFAVRPFAQPALVVHGEYDQAIPLTLGQELCRLGSCARLHTALTASHMLPLSQADLLARLTFG